MTFRISALNHLAACLFIFFSAGFQGAFAQEIAEGQAKAFTQTMFEEAVSSFVGPALPLPEREKRLRHLIEKFCDPSIVGQDVTGRYWDKADPTVKRAFPKLFVDYVVANYKRSLSDVAPQTDFAIKEFQASGGKALVSGIVTVPNEPISNLGVLLTNSGGKLVAIDLNVDGVSIVKTLRDDFTSVLRANGGDMNKLMDVMKAKIAMADKG